MLKVDVDEKYRHRCCGHSDARTPELSRYRCARCGSVVAPDALEFSADGWRHRVNGEHCGPVRQEKARSHAALMEWLWEASHR